MREEALARIVEFFRAHRPVGRSRFPFERRIEDLDFDVAHH